MVDSILILKSQVIVDSYEDEKKYAHTAKHPKKVIFFAFEASSSTYISLPLPGMMDCFLCVFLPPLPMCNCVLATICHTLKH